MDTDCLGLGKASGSSGAVTVLDGWASRIPSLRPRAVDPAAGAAADFSLIVLESVEIITADRQNNRSFSTGEPEA